MRASQAAAAAQAPQPLPLPLPPLSLPSSATAPRRGRHRTSSSSSSSSSSSTSTSSSVSAGGSSSFYSSSCGPSSPSPAASPPRASLVPFSWERHPGVPKSTCSFRGGGSPAPPLPLPPPLRRPAPRRRRRRLAHADDVSASAAGSSSSSSSDPAGANSCDPFVAAFAECTRDGADPAAADNTTADHGSDDVVADKTKLWQVARTTKPAAASSAGHADQRRRWLGAPGGLVGFFDLYGCKSAVAVVADGAYLARRPVGASRRAR